MSPNHKYQPIILIGAARSGTKLTRDIIGRHPDIDVVPYDVNYIWRIGNEHAPDDVLLVQSLSLPKKQQIIQQVESFRTGKNYIIEKTVQNSVRVPFVHAVFPDAKFLHLIRDGRDVIESAYREWTASPDWRYIFKKVRTFPLTKAFGYGVSYAMGVLKKAVFRNRAKAQVTWGPRYTGIDDDVRTRKLIEVCALQWVHSVTAATKTLQDIPAAQVFTLRYEDFVTNPGERLREIAAFIGVDPVPYQDENLLGNISPKNIGKGLRNLSQQDVDLVLPILRDTLLMLGYDI